jgi:hypothetical protein
LQRDTESGGDSTVLILTFNKLGPKADLLSPPGFNHCGAKRKCIGPTVIKTNRG